MRLRLVIASLIVGLLVFSPARSQVDAPLDVVVSFSILADVVQNVGGAHVELFSLVPVGADPHGYEPSAQDIARLSGADLIFVAGAGFEQTLLNTIRSAASGALIIEASACVPIRHYGDDAPESHPAETLGNDNAADAVGLDLHARCADYAADINRLDPESLRVAADESLLPLFASDCAAGAVDDGHDHGACDPHVWTDPHSIDYWTLYIRDVLSAADPANADAYHVNAETYRRAIDDLVRRQLEPLLAEIPADRRVLMANHDTLGYFAAAYGFAQAGFVLPGGSALAEPSARDLAVLIDTVRQQQVTAIFTESTLSARVAEQIAAETGAQLYLLYSDSLSGPDGPAFTYLDYLTYNFTTIAAALTPQ